MKIEKQTIDILSNFQTINQQIVINSGHRLRTMSQSDSIVAQANVQEEFTDPIYIHDLGKLLSILSLSDENDIDVRGKDLVITQDKSVTKFRMAEPALLKKIPTGDLKFPNSYIEFDLPSSILTKTRQAKDILGFNEICFSGDGEKLYSSTINTKNPDDNSYSTIIGETDKVFQCILETEKLKMINTDYYVRVSDKGLVHFKGNPIDYYITVSNKSKFE